MPTYTGINHLAMATKDMNATIKFWRDLLGMRLILGMGHPGYRHYFFRITNNDMIAFFEWPKVEPIPEKDHGVPVKGPHAFDHLSIQVSCEDDLFELKDKLEAAGFWVSEPIDHGFIKSIYSFDPNNIPIEFSVVNPEMDITENPGMYDDSPCPLATGPDPVAGTWPEPSAPTRKEDKVFYPGEDQIDPKKNKFK